MKTSSTRSTLFCQSTTFDQMSCARRIPNMDTANSYFAGSCLKVMQQQNLYSYTICLGNQWIYLYWHSCSESLETACDLKWYLYIMWLQGSALDMSQKQGCTVQIKLLTKEVTNYQLIGIAFKLTVIPWNPLWILVCFGGKILRWPEIQEIWTGLPTI